MAKYALQLDGDSVVSGWHGTGNVIPPGTTECTREQLGEFQSKPAVFGGSKLYRWTFIDQDLAESRDPRPKVTWVDTEGVSTTPNDTDADGNITIETFDDQSDPKVTLRYVDDLSYNPANPDVVKVGNRLMSLPFNDGDALLEIRSLGMPRRDTYESCDLFQMTNTFTIRVAAVKL